MWSPSTAAPEPLARPRKLRIPQAGAHDLPRTELVERIFHAGSARLVLLRAPAGFGKTTVMLQLRERLAETGVPTVWLTLDGADNDAGRLLAALATALAPWVQGLLSPDLCADATGTEALALQLMARLAAREQPLAIFLDDFEALQNPEVLALVRELIDQLPRGVQLIVGARCAPELGLGRLRARGRLLDIDPAQLRFSERETEEFLRRRRGLALAADDLQRLHRSTEGWAVALWLASVSLLERSDAHRFIAGFSGSNAAVVDYLSDDVLARQPAEVRDFLLRTSLLDEFDASLCDAVCGRSDSHEMLARLDRAHLFLIALQDDRSLYRYHGMFGQFLRGQAARQLGREVPAMHLAACAWYAERGRPVPAIDHALQSGDPARAIALLAGHAPALLEQGRVRLLARWLDPLMERGGLSSHPLLQVVHAWSVCLARGAREATPWLERLEAADIADPVLRAHCQALRLLLLVLSDRIEEALPRAAELACAVPPGLSFVSGFVDVTLANLALNTGRHQDALRFADAARRPAAVKGAAPGAGEEVGPFNFAMSEATEAAVSLVQGRLRQAIAGLRQAASAGVPGAAANSWALDMARATSGNALIGVPLAEALYESGQCAQAERLLVVYIPLIRRVGIPDQLITAHVTMARIVHERGDADHAEQLLAALEHIGHGSGLPRVIASARIERARQLTLADRLGAARAELDRCADPGLWARVARLAMRANEVETHDVAEARWALRSGRAGEVLPALRRELDAAERAGRLRRALTLRLLLAQATWREGDRRRAMRLLAEGVRFACAEGFVRAFIDEGEPVLAMLRELRAQPDLLAQGGGAAGGPAFSGFMARLLPEPDGQARTGPGLEPRPGGAVPPPHDLLTRKELQVLSLAAEGLSNAELAERLFVAETTVRSHLRNINVKLDARNRMEAIAIARRARLMA